MTLIENFLKQKRYPEHILNDKMLRPFYSQGTVGTALHSQSTRICIFLTIQCTLRFYPNVFFMNVRNESKSEKYNTGIWYESNGINIIESNFINITADITIYGTFYKECTPNRISEHVRTGQLINNYLRMKMQVRTPNCPPSERLEWQECKSLRVAYKVRILRQWYSTYPTDTCSVTTYGTYGTYGPYFSSGSVTEQCPLQRLAYFFSLSSVPTYGTYGTYGTYFPSGSVIEQCPHKRLAYGKYPTNTCSVPTNGTHGTHGTYGTYFSSGSVIEKCPLQCLAHFFTLSSVPTYGTYSTYSPLRHLVHFFTPSSVPIYGTYGTYGTNFSSGSVIEKCTVKHHAYFFTLSSVPANLNSLPTYGTYGTNGAYFLSGSVIKLCTIKRLANFSTLSLVPAYLSSVPTYGTHGTVGSNFSSPDCWHNSYFKHANLFTLSLVPTHLNTVPTYPSSVPTYGICCTYGIYGTYFSSGSVIKLCGLKRLANFSTLGAVPAYLSSVPTHGTHGTYGIHFSSPDCWHKSYFKHAFFLL